VETSKVGRRSAEVYVATESGIHRSTDNGKTFTQFQSLE
jgi:hypothetical protein